VNAPRLLTVVAVALGVLAPAASADSWSPELLSTGPLAGGAYDAHFDDASSDGSRLFFSTDEPLVAEDHNGLPDVYMRAGGATTLVSGGAAGDGGDFGAISPDGSRAFFSTAAKLTPNDTDSAIDVYQWHDGDLTLLSDGLANDTSDLDPNDDATFQMASRDGSHVFFSTVEQLSNLPAGHPDTDSAADIYEYFDGHTERVSVGDDQDSSTLQNQQVVGSTPDGSHVYWLTGNSLEPTDTDTTNYGDIYERFDGHTKEISVGTGGIPHDVSFNAVSDDGSRVLFSTEAAIPSTGDDDSATDVYLRSGSTTQLVTGGPSTSSAGAGFLRANADVTDFVFATEQPMVGDDNESASDVYLRHIGATPTTTLVSRDAAGDNTPQDVSFDGATPDLSHLFFETKDALVPSDADGGYDVFDRSGGTTSLITTGPTDDLSTPSDDGYFGGVSDDGSRVFFGGTQSFTPDDTDGDGWDVYEHSGDVTRLVSNGPTGTAKETDIAANTADGRIAFLDSWDPLTSADTDSDGEDIYSALLVAPATAPVAETPSSPAPSSGEQPRRDITAPLLKIRHSGRQRILRQHGIFVTLSGNEDSTARLTGTVSVPGGAAKVLRFKSAKRSLKAGKSAKVKLALGKGALKKVAKALKRGKKLKAKVTVVVTDAAGNRSVKKLTVALKR
jgi:hypothetical protein